MDEESALKWLTTFRIVLIIFLLGLFVYGNAIFNGFFADDYHQIIDNRMVHSLTSIPKYFTGSTFYQGSEQLTGNYYKPVFLTSYALLYALFGVNPFGYHLVQVLLHICNALLLFFLLKYFFKKPTAFLIAILFLIHPINNEAVVYIADLQDVLYLSFGLLALVVSIYASLKGKSIVIAILLLSSLLSKETGILFLLIVPLLPFLKNKRGDGSLTFDRKSFIKNILVDFVVLGVYCFLRFVIAGIYFNKIIMSPIMLLSLPERLLQIPKIVLYYLQTFFFPKDLVIFQSWLVKSADWHSFFLPLILDLIFFTVLTGIGIGIYRNVKAYFALYLFFLAWFLIGLLFHIQLYPLDGTVADRWFYFPIIGLLGILGILMELLWQRYHHSEIIKNYALTLFILIICIFSLRVMVRNANWYDQMTLLKHDIQSNPDSFQLQEGLGLELMKTGDYAAAYPHLLRSTQLFPGVNNLTSLGVYYANTKQFTKAKTTFEKAMQYDDLSLTYEDYALLLVLSGDIKTCESFSKNAVKKFPQSDKLWLYLAMSSYALGHDDEALQAAQNSESLHPRHASEYVLTAIKNHQKIDLSQM